MYNDYVYVITQTLVTLSCHLIYMIQVLSELEEAELREEREKLAAENKNGEENKYALDIIRPGILDLQSFMGSLLKVFHHRRKFFLLLMLQ